MHVYYISVNMSYYLNLYKADINKGITIFNYILLGCKIYEYSLNPHLTPHINSFDDKLP